MNSFHEREQFSSGAHIDMHKRVCERLVSWINPFPKYASTRTYSINAEFDLCNSITNISNVNSSSDHDIFKNNSLLTTSFVFMNRYVQIYNLSFIEYIFVYSALTNPLLPLNLPFTFYYFLSLPTLD